MSGDIKSFEVLTAAELLRRFDTPEGKRAARDSEASFRRGYCHAFSDVIDLIGKASKSELIAFFDGELYQWRYGKSLEGMPPPPEFKVSKTRQQRRCKKGRSEQ